MRKALAAVLALSLSLPALADPIPGTGGGGGGGPETDPIYNLEKGSAGGAATLDGSTKVPLGQLPEMGAAQLQDGGVDSVKLAFGTWVGGSTTFAGLPAAGSVAKDGDWSVLHADDGLTQAGLYQLVSGVWTLRLEVPEQGVLSGATPPGSCTSTQPLFVETDQSPPLLYGCFGGSFVQTGGGGGSFTPDADPGVDHSGFDAAVAAAPAPAANTAHAASTSNPHGVTAGQVASTATGDVAATDLQAAVAELAAEKATVAALSGHTGDTGNPHGVTAGQAGALASGHAASGVTDAGSGVVISAAERSKLAGIEASAKDDQVAADVPVTAVGNLGSTQAQDAFEELQADIDALVAGGGTPVSVDGGAPLAAVNLDSVGDADYVLCTGAGAPDAACQAANDVILRLNAGSVGWLSEIANDLGCGALEGVRRNAANAAWECFTPGGGGGDEVSVGGSATTDPDLRSEGDLDFILCSAAGVPDAACLADQDVIARVRPNSVALGTDTIGGYAASASEAGPATTALALDADPADCPAGQVPDGVDAAGVASDCTPNADQAELDAHTGDSGNPHGVTAGQAGAEPSGSVAAHAALPDVHHAAPTSGTANPIDGTTPCARVNQRYQNTTSGDQFYCVAVGSPAGSDWEPWPDEGAPDGSATPEQPTGATGAVGSGPAHAFEDHRHPTPAHSAIQGIGANDHHTPPAAGSLAPVEPTGATGAAGVAAPYSREDHRHPTAAHGALQGVGASDHHTQTPDQVGTVTDGQYCQGAAGSTLDCDVLPIPGPDVGAATEAARGSVELATGAETAAGLAVQANDPRLSDARSPTAHASTHAENAADELLVESLGTAGGAGTAPVSDGLGGLDPVDVATQAELDNHTGDTSNPHAVTVAQIGAESETHASEHAPNAADPVQPALTGASDPVNGTTACDFVSRRYQNTTTGDQFVCLTVGAPAGSVWVTLESVLNIGSFDIESNLSPIVSGATILNFASDFTVTNAGGGRATIGLAAQVSKLGPKIGIAETEAGEFANPAAAASITGVWDFVNGFTALNLGTFASWTPTVTGTGTATGAEWKRLSDSVVIDVNLTKNTAPGMLEFTLPAGMVLAGSPGDFVHFCRGSSTQVVELNIGTTSRLDVDISLAIGEVVECRGVMAKVTTWP